MDINELKDKANSGDLDSMVELARCFMMGNGTPIDYEKSILYLHQASHLGSPIAMAELAICYSQGMYVEKDIKKALDLFHNAACQGIDVRDEVYQSIDKHDLYNFALEGYPTAEYYYALTLGNDDATKRDSLIASAGSKRLALAVGALALKSYLSNPVPSNLEAKKLFQQAVDCGYDYLQVLNQIALTEQQLGIEHDLNICDTVRGFIAEKYKRPFILVRVTSKKRADDLYNNGTVCFQSLGEYRKVNKSGVGDIHEGIANTNIPHPFWNEIGDETLFKRCDVSMYSEYMAYEKICCFYALEYSEDKQFVLPDIRMRQFGDSVVVIWNGLEFCQRIENKLKQEYGESIQFKHRRVDYDIIFSKSNIYTEFSKTESFAWQNEYRFVIDLANGRLERSVWNEEPKKGKKQNIFEALGGMSEFAKLMYLSSGGKLDFFEDPGKVLLSIGNIRDISDVYSIEDFINLNDTITKKAVPYRLNESL